MNEALQQVINRNDTWRGQNGRFANHILSANGDQQWSQKTLSTGYNTLNAQLQQGGWPLDSTIELLSDGSGLGSLPFCVSRETIIMNRQSPTKIRNDKNRKCGQASSDGQCMR